MDSTLKREFRQGFFPDRLASWIEDPAHEAAEISADVEGCVRALAAGQEDFAYPGHDRAVLRLLRSLVADRSLKHAADIGCATGCFPAMQIAAGVDTCTVFEVRPVELNHDQVAVRVEDLTYLDDIEPEFDLVTCLSTIEHVGLGRYGDPQDPWGDIKMAANLRRMVKPGGLLMLSFPSGPGCVVFNKHRIYTPHRASALMGDFKQLCRARDRSLLGALRQGAASMVGRVGSFWQPIYVLEKPAG